MSTDPQDQELVAEFETLLGIYEAKAKLFEASIAAAIQRRREIVYELVENRGGLQRRTYREVGRMLGLSAARIGQLVLEHKHEHSTPASPSDDS